MKAVIENTILLCTYTLYMLKLLVVIASSTIILMFT